PVLSNFMHFMRTNLYFKRVPLRPDYSRMKGLIHIRLRHRYIVFKTARQRLPYRMDDTEDCITVLDVIYEHPHCKQVENLVELLALLFHLLIYAVYMFRPSRQRALYTRLIHLVFDFIDCFIDDFFTLTAFLFHHADNLEILFRFNIPKCRVFK